MTLEFYTPRQTLATDAVRVYVKARNLVFNRPAAERFLAGVARIRLAWDAEPPVRIVMVPTAAETAETLAVYRSKDGRAAVSSSGFFGRFPEAKFLIGKAIQVTHGVDGVTLRPAAEGAAIEESVETMPAARKPETPVTTTVVSADRTPDAETDLPKLTASQKLGWRCRHCGYHLTSWEYCYNPIGHPKRCQKCKGTEFEPFVITLKRCRYRQGTAAQKAARPVTTRDLDEVDAAVEKRQPVPAGLKHRTIWECTECGAEYDTLPDRCGHCPGTGSIRMQIVPRRLDVGPVAQTV